MRWLYVLHHLLLERVQLCGRMKTGPDRMCCARLWKTYANSQDPRPRTSATGGRGNSSTACSEHCSIADCLEVEDALGTGSSMERSSFMPAMTVEPRKALRSLSQTAPSGRSTLQSAVSRAIDAVGFDRGMGRVRPWAWAGALESLAPGLGDAATDLDWICAARRRPK